mgnify:CR=1 FL=1
MIERMQVVEKTRVTPLAGSRDMGILPPLLISLHSRKGVPMIHKTPNPELWDLVEVLIG